MLTLYDLTCKTFVTVCHTKLSSLHQIKCSFKTTFFFCKNKLFFFVVVSVCNKISRKLLERLEGQLNQLLLKNIFIRL